MKVKWTEIGLAVLGIGAAVLAIVHVKDHVQALAVRIGRPIPDSVFDFSLTVGALFVVSGFILVVGVLLVRLFRRPIGKVVSVVVRDPRFECSSASRDELKQVHDFCVQMFGPEIATLQQLSQWHERNAQLFWIVREFKSGRIIGYFSLIPINKRAARLVEQKGLSASQFTPDHIVKTNGKPAAIYIGGIGAKGRMGRAVTLAHLKDRVDHERKRGVSVFFARPVTQKGLELVEKYRFVPVNAGGLGSIYRRSNW